LLRRVAIFLVRRVIHALLVLVFASILAFTLASIAPGDYFDEMRLSSDISPATLEKLRAHYGLDRPMHERYRRWITSIPKGEWGFSFAYNSPAGPILLSRCRNTLLLTSVATALAWLGALIWGGWAALHQGGIVDHVATGVTAFLLAVPEIVLALCLLLFAVRTGYLPVGGLNLDATYASGLWSVTAEVAKHLALPALVLAAGSLPFLLSHVRSAIAETLRSPFIEAAVGNGIPPVRILSRHAFPAAANPLITLFGTSLGMLISSSLLTEAVFSWPGIGQLMLEAIQSRDFFLVVDSALLSTAFFVAGTLVADILLYLADPRIRAE